MEEILLLLEAREAHVCVDAHHAMQADMAIGAQAHIVVSSVIGTSSHACASLYSCLNCLPPGGSAASQQRLLKSPFGSRCLGQAAGLKLTGSLQGNGLIR